MCSQPVGFSSIWRRSRLGLLLLAPLALWGQAAQTGRTEPGLPFVSNNGFDIWAPSDTDDWPVDWARGKGLTWLNEGGRSFMRLTQEPPGGALVFLYREFAVPMDVKAFRFETVVRATGVVAGEKAWFDARVIMQFTDDQKQKIKGSPPAIIITRKGSTDWKKLGRTFAVPAGATRIECMVALFQTAAGVLDVDLFNLEPIDPALLAPAPAVPAPTATPAAPAAPVAASAPATP